MSMLPDFKFILLTHPLIVGLGTHFLRLIPIKDSPDGLNKRTTKNHFLPRFLHQKLIFALKSEFISRFLHFGGISLSNSGSVPRSGKVRRGEV
jgi:hypothetical protein